MPPHLNFIFYIVIITLPSKTHTTANIDAMALNAITAVFEKENVDFIKPNM